MHRMQISLTTTQYEFLQSEAFVTGKSMAAILRAMLDETIQQRQQDVLANDPIWDVIGVGETIDGPTDISENVDKYLYGEPVNQAVPLQKIADDSDEYTPH